MPATDTPTTGAQRETAYLEALGVQRLDALIELLEHSVARYAASRRMPRGVVPLKELERRLSVAQAEWNRRFPAASVGQEG
jgi:hypothetical protein